MRLPLDGIRVVECAIFHAGPGTSAIMGDLGAEVIKIEQPEVGDPIRWVQRIGRIPMTLAGGKSVFFEGSNRNKKSVTLNLREEKGYEALCRLIKDADVFLINFRQPAIKEMKLTYDELRKINPRLIYASVSAFGAKGPDKDQGGFDYQGQARSGLMYSMGEEGAPPVGCQFGLADQATAFNACHQIVVALLARERFGEGQAISVSILGSSLNMLYFNMLITYLAKITVPRHDRANEYPMRNYYKSSDDRWLMMTLTPPDRHWPPLCEALGKPDLEKDPRFATDELRLKNSTELVKIIDEVFATRPLAEWLKIFKDHDLFCCAVNRLDELHEDPQVVANDYIIDFKHPAFGEIKLPGYPAQFSGCKPGPRTAAPDLGEHTDEILTSIGGYTKEEIASMREKGIA